MVAILLSKNSPAYFIGFLASFFQECSIAHQSCLCTVSLAWIKTSTGPMRAAYCEQSSFTHRSSSTTFHSFSRTECTLVPFLEQIRLLLPHIACESFISSIHTVCCRRRLRISMLQISFSPQQSDLKSTISPARVRFASLQRGRTRKHRLYVEENSVQRDERHFRVWNFLLRNTIGRKQIEKWTRRRDRSAARRTRRRRGRTAKTFRTFHRRGIKRTCSKHVLSPRMQVLRQGMLKPPDVLC